MVIAPCWAIHTISMRFSIDVIFVDGDGTVLRIARELAPWRFAVTPGAYAAIELAAGAAELRGVKKGDRLYARSGDGFKSTSSFFAVPSFRRMAAKPACSGS